MNSKCLFMTDNDLSVGNDKKVLREVPFRIDRTANSQVSRQTQLGTNL